MLPQPYYQRGDMTLYHGDCVELLPLIDAETIDAVVTDPPYPSYHVELYRFSEGSIFLLNRLQCVQFIFWTPSAPFPLPWNGKRIWDKCVGTCTQFEEIYERRRGSGFRIHRAYSMGCFSSVGAKMTGEVISGHPSQKPIKLIVELVEECPGNCILDPFLGSGTTAVACLRTGRRCIGIEIEEKYCEIAAKRIDRELDQGRLFKPEPARERQLELIA
jgi:site-specific DNA-methyltransferase (adenine-specific)